MRSSQPRIWIYGYCLPQYLNKQSSITLSVTLASKVTNSMLLYLSSMSGSFARPLSQPALLPS